MDNDAAAKTIEALEKRLVALLDLQLTLKHIHWNVVGPNFIGVHEMLAHKGHGGDAQWVPPCAGPVQEGAEGADQRGGQGLLPRAGQLLHVPPVGEVSSYAGRTRWFGTPQKYLACCPFNLCW